MILGTGIGLTRTPSGEVPPSVFYAWNSADKDPAITLSDTDHKATTSTGSRSVRGVTGHGPTVKRYFELRVPVPAVTNGSLFGIGRAAAALTTYPGGNADSWGFFLATGAKVTNNAQTAYAAAYTTPAALVFGVLLDNGVLSFYVDGNDLGEAFSGITGTVYPMWAMAAAGSHEAIINTGDTPFAYPAPAGAVAWG
jgi:hypothetical protein